MVCVRGFIGVSPGQLVTILANLLPNSCIAHVHAVIMGSWAIILWGRVDWAACGWGGDFWDAPVEGWKGAAAGALSVCPPPASKCSRSLVWWLDNLLESST